jgi:hypothetical protein
MGHPHDGASIGGGVWNPSGAEILAVVEPQWWRDFEQIETGSTENPSMNV